MSADRTFLSVQELLEASELVDILTYQLSAELSDEPATPLSMRVLTRCEGGKLEVRIDAALNDSYGEYTLARSVIFSLPPERDVPQPLVEEFAEKVGVLAAYPYIREGISDLAARLGQPQPVLPLLRAGQVKLARNSHDKDSSEQPASAE
ncbi:SecB-like chaperone SecBL [Nocardia niigatensis]